MVSEESAVAFLRRPPQQYPISRVHKREQIIESVEFAAALIPESDPLIVPEGPLPAGLKQHGLTAREEIPVRRRFERARRHTLRRNPDEPRF